MANQVPDRANNPKRKPQTWVSPSSEDVETHRNFWSDIAKKNNWHKEPFHVQVWHDKNGNITDSVSHQGMTQDFIVKDRDRSKD